MERPRRDLTNRRRLEDRGLQKQVSSPAQQATKAWIAKLQDQLRRLKGFAKGTQDPKRNYQIHCVEEELKKANSKLRRLLNEALRQRRRRERLRGEPPDDNDPLADSAVLTTLKSCSRFTDVVRGLGFTVMQNDDYTDESEPLPEVDGVKAEVELIEGDAEPRIKEEPLDSPSSSQTLASLDIEYQKNESYRQWYERQVESQRQWEERMMREQMELAKSMLESVTNTFVQGLQQVIHTLSNARTFASYPSPPEPP